MNNVIDLSRPQPKNTKTYEIRDIKITRQELAILGKEICGVTWTFTPPLTMPIVAATVQGVVLGAACGQQNGQIGIIPEVLVGVGIVEVYEIVLSEARAMVLKLQEEARAAAKVVIK